MPTTTDMLGASALEPRTDEADVTSHALVSARPSSASTRKPRHNGQAVSAMGRPYRSDDDDLIRECLMNYMVRIARPEDFPSLAEMTVRVYKDLLPAVQGAEDYLVRMRDVASRAKQTELLVAIDDTSGEVLGGVSFAAPGTAYAQTARSDEGEFRQLAVAPNARQRGIGEALVRACLDRATELGLRGVAITTQPNMVSAQRLYERIGFVRAPERDVEPAPGVQLWAYTIELTGTADHRR